MPTRLLNRLTPLCRIILGVTFVLSGFVKVVDPWGTALKVEEYLAIYGFEWLNRLSMGFSVWLCGAELMMGCMLLFKVRIRLISIFALFSILFFTILTFLSATWLPVEDCGCFGDAVKLSPWGTFAKNLVLLPMAALVWYRYRPDRIFAFRPVEILLTCLFFSLSMGIGIWCSRHLPLIDFLPYKVGVDLRTAWLNPESERMDEDREQHETILVYRNRRTGEVREFALDDPEWQNDELWEWEETRTHFETPSIRPIISEFALRDPGGDITEEVLRTEGRLYMICIASFDRVRHGCAHRLRMLIERADREGASVLCLTPGPLDEEARHAFLGSRLVRCCNIDVHTLKTLLRANNGVVVLEDGVITAKMNCRDIPL
ncbi:BT_3928 family protein [uncultured Alistipes sp.]|uniref:BT_3928 family protein n=1 Tax=uncultured Alistipes sp. TaxID=538949 RepID=UPI0026320E44|nr:BT_3928 family protein [uncultured Alistipes sp.]